MLRERIATFDPRALGASLNNVQEQEALQVLDRYAGTFRYIHAAGGFGYCTFLVVDDGHHYVFRVTEADLPHLWTETVPTRYVLDLDLAL